MTDPPTLVVGPVRVYLLPDGSLTWQTGASICGDGSPRCYSLDPALPALDALSCAGRPGNWWALACDADGVPVIQGPGDPAPGYPVSTTACQDFSKKETDPARYLDAEVVPYLVVPPGLHRLGVKIGDVARASRVDLSTTAIVGDRGNEGVLREMSVACARALKIPDSCRTGGCKDGVTVRLWPGSSRGWPRAQSEIESQVAALEAGA